MTKNLTLLILSLLFFQAAKAQRDSVRLYMKNSGQQVAAKEQADYILTVMIPPDSSSGIKVDSIKEYYTNYSPLFTGKAMLYVNNNLVSYKFVGTCTNFYRNGKKSSIVHYKNGQRVGYESEFYPNGRLYAIEKYSNGNRLCMVECHDTTGNTLAVNGNGTWLKYDVNFQQIIEKGQIVDSLEEGEWEGTIVNDTTRFKNNYIKGVMVSSTDSAVNRSINQQIFAAVEREPEFPHGGAYGFNSFLVKYVKFPPEDIKQGISGRVIVTFVVEKDGALTDVKVLRSPSEALGEEAVRVVKLSPPWRPGMQNGQPVRVQYTISFAFDLSK